jgi:hypothetical protein
MTTLYEKDFAIFDRKQFAFKQLKENHTEEELSQVKASFKNLLLIILHSPKLKVGQMVGIFAHIIGVPIEEHIDKTRMRVSVFC